MRDPRAIMNPAGPCPITLAMVVRNANHYAMVFRQANSRPLVTLSPRWPYSLVALFPGGTAPAAQGYAGFGEDAVDEPVRSAGRGREGADGLAGVIALLEVGREPAAVFPGHPGSFSERR